MTSEIKVDTISEQTSANGVTIDGLTIKDGNIIGDVALAGTTPTFTIGDGGAEDAALIFDGNAVDFVVGLDDSADEFRIGVGSGLGSDRVFEINSSGVSTFQKAVQFAGSTPTVTVGDGGAEDAKILFDGNEQNFHIGLDDSTNKLTIGLGNALGTYPGFTMDENTNVEFPDNSVTIISSANNDNLTLKTTDTDANIGPNLNLYRDAGNGADADNLATIAFAGNDDAGNATDFARITAQIEDASNGSEDVYLYIRTITAGTERQRLVFDSTQTVFNEESVDIDFRVETDSQTHGLFVDAGNNMVAVNNSTYDNAQFKVQQDTADKLIARFEHHNGSGNNYGLRIEHKGQAPDNNTSDFLVCGDTGASRMIIYSDGDIQNHDNAYTGISDERLKEQIKDSDSQWNDIKAVKVKKFKFKSDVSNKGDSESLWRLGVVAQDLEAAGMNGLVKSEVLFQADDPDLKDNNVGDIKHYKSAKYSILYMKAIKALQEAQTRIETLETKVAALEG